MVLGDNFPYADPRFKEWKQRLEVLPSADAQCREAEPSASDGRWLRWMQADCESTYIHSVEDNVSKIEQQSAWLAEIADVPVGFCLALAGRSEPDPVFVQLVAVVPLARRRGAGLALLRAVSEQYPQRNVVMATRDDNVAAQQLNLRFAKSIGGVLRRVPVRRYRRADLGFAQGERHRPWVIDRSPD